jgi:hypothetical protein
MSLDYLKKLVKRLDSEGKNGIIASLCLKANVV